ncbi:type I-E CRISPR-associated protein Cse1/CasA [Streptomyces sp. WAC01280]|uniref:type I-E CRISPR-associated protein Cse1/CasA n=1 Tax=Streptomyces sp. WAC01280 TaxID=2487424 RepID=UPI000F77A64C|nr:type I-E CRISPR-associated protein Cse1/CasA [Streptomyces sp. WAC01280]RSS57442.1 type I-E CRISPR-associated protein Cse1/CasA [Streptomyces sp. WAC01280]
MPESSELGSLGLSFDLTTRPWVEVLRLDGVQEELSLREVFARAGELRRVTGDLPTQEFALVRLLLAIAHDAFEGPADVEEWSLLWNDPQCFNRVGDYLDTYRDRFDLLHAKAPFFQTAGLRTAKDEVFSLNRIVADVPNGEPFFTARMPAVSRLGFAEAARWVVHAHAYDTSGIKSGVEGDPRAKGGKVYPLGVGWAGNLGGVFVEGRNLRETLLLNLVADDTGGLRFESGDLPAWRREPRGPGGMERTPTGVRDLYTWQSRRLRLHVDAEGAYGVVLGYGDPLHPRNRHVHEPMTAWRRSEAQEKKHGEALVYMPREHDPERSAWRGLDSLIADRAQDATTGSDAPRFLRPGILEWIARLVTEGELPRGFLVRARTVGARYGTQQSVVDEVVDDHLTMAVALLHRQDREYAQQAIDAVTDADQAVRALGDLASDLQRAAGKDNDSPRVAARDRAFGALEGPYRMWLSGLGSADDPYEQRTVWQRQVYRIVAGLGERLIADAGEAAWQGRTMPAKQGSVWLNSSLARMWFTSRLGKALGNPYSDQSSDAAALASTGPSQKVQA